MIYSKTVIISLAAVLCIAAATSSYWSQALSLNQRYGLAIIGIIEIALLIWHIVCCRRPGRRTRDRRSFV